MSENHAMLSERACERARLRCWIAFELSSLFPVHLYKEYPSIGCEGRNLPREAISVFISRHSYFSSCLLFYFFVHLPKSVVCGEEWYDPAACKIWTEKDGVTIFTHATCVLELAVRLCGKVLSDFVTSVSYETSCPYVLLHLITCVIFSRYRERRRGRRTLLVR